MSPRILTIEDDTAIRRGIVDAIRFAGFETLESGTAKEGQMLALTSDISLLLLDWVLPDGDGLTILREVRSKKPTLPIIVLTAKGEESDRVRGLDNGADDYVVKPFSIRELLARIEAVLRRSPQRPNPIDCVQAPGLTIDFHRREVRFDSGQRETLSEKESDLLLYLASHRGRAITREEILSSVWQLTPKGITTRTIDMHITRLREKLLDNGSNPHILLTVRGKGYMFAAITSGASVDD